MDHAQAGAGQHGDRQLRNHGHVDGYAISRLQSGEITQQGRHLIHPAVELLIGDGHREDFFRLAYENKCGFIGVLGQVPVHAVVAGIEFAAGIPLPERSVTGIERGVPVLVPVQQVSIFTVAFGKILFAEALVYGRIRQVGLPDKF